MMNHKPKLELTWIGKDVRPKLEPQILLEVPPSFGNSGEASPAKSYHAKHRVSDKDIFDKPIGASFQTGFVIESTQNRPFLMIPRWL